MLQDQRYKILASSKIPGEYFSMKSKDFSVSLKIFLALLSKKKISKRTLKKKFLEIKKISEIIFKKTFNQKIKKKNSFKNSHQGFPNLFFRILDIVNTLFKKSDISLKKIEEFFSAEN